VTLIREFIIRKKIKKDWWKINNLNELEKNVKSTSIDELDLKNYFASYRKVFETDSFENSRIEFHNDLDPRSKILYIAEELKIDFKKKYKILDIGCGLGFTTFQLKKIFKNSIVTGIDISSDAIMYAEKNFKDCLFIQQGIDPANKIIGKFDIVFAFEFYPFTRTNDWTTHRKYIDYFLKNINMNGLFIITQLWTNHDSISYNYQKIINNYKASLHKTLSKKLYKFKSFVPMFFLKIVDRLIKIIKKREAKTLVIRR